MRRPVALSSVSTRTSARRALRTIAALLATLALVFTAGPQVARAAGSVTVGSGSGIRGSVALSDGGDSFVTIVAYRIIDGEEDWAADDIVQGGAFEFPELVAGTYVVRLSSGGYRGLCYGGDPCTPIAVVDGSASVLGPVVLERTAPGTVTGRVLAGDGTPLPGVAIRATYEQEEVDTQTDATGSWVLADLASELPWNVEFTKAGLSPYQTWVYPSDGGTTDVGISVLTAPGHVSGTVHDAGGAAIEAAMVYLQPTSGGGSQHVETGTDGSYDLTAVEPGRYRVYVVAAGHPDTYFPAVQYYEDAALVSVGERQSVTADVTMNAAASLSGHLTDVDANPVQGLVLLWEKDAGSVAESYADTDGGYSFTGLWPGTYSVRAVVPSYQSTWLGNVAGPDDATWRELASGADSVANDITLPARERHTISGTVTDTAGNPAAQLTVRFGDVFEVLTDADGQFSAASEDAGTFDVVISAGAGLVCGGGAPACPVPTVTVPATGDLEVALTVPRLGSLSGAITVPAEVSAHGAELLLVDAAGNVLAGFSFEEATDYTFLAVPFGTYTLRAEGSGFAPFTTAVTIDGAVTKDVPLSAGFSISGTITVPQQEDWVEVRVLDPATSREVDSDWIDGPVSGPAGYTISHLAPGAYLVGVHERSGGWTWYPGVGDVGSATPVQVVDHDLTDVSLPGAAIPDLVAVTGHLTLPDGSAIPADNDLYVSYRNRATGRTYGMWTQAQGAYHLTLPIGDYLVRVGSNDHLGTAPLSEQLGVPAAITHDITLVAGGTLTGRLVDADGLAVDGRVWLTAAGAAIGGDTYANRWGYWSIGSLPAGQVQLHASADGFVDAVLGTFDITAGRTSDAGTLALVAAGRLPVRLPEVGDSSITTIVTDPAGTTISRTRAWPGERFWIRPLPAGTVLVRFEGKGITTEWWRDAATAAEATPVTIRAGTSASVLTPRLATAQPQPDGTVSGTFTNSTGRAGQLWVTVTGSGEYATAAVKPDGSWSLDIAPGTYRVKAGLCVGFWLGESGCAGERITAWYPGVAYADAQTVAVTSGHTTSGIDVALGATPSFTGAPVPGITGKAELGETLTAVPGTWTPAPDHLAFQWLRDGMAIAGATGETYAVTADELGTAITVTVTATKAGFRTATRTSAATAAVVGVIMPGAVRVTPATAVGVTLTADPGSWTPAGVGLAYQWLRDGAAIQGATAASYTVQLADAGRKLSVRVTGTKAGFAKAEVTAAAGTVPWLHLTTTPVPTITGTAKIGSLLTAKPGTWAPGTVGLAYQWLRNGADIGGATRATYTVVGADAGRTLSVRVTGSAPGYEPVARTSAATAKVPSGKMTTRKPTISGTARVGRVLTARISGWKPADASFTYTWYRSGRTIKGATAATYTLVGADAGRTIKVKVTGTATGYPSASATSKSTKKVAKGTITAGRTEISGTAQVGQLVQVDTGDWRPAGLRFAYQWYRSGKAIRNARSAGYTVTGADLGRKLTVRVTASLTGYNTASRTSKATAAVIAP